MPLITATDLQGGSVPDRTAPLMMRAARRRNDPVDVRPVRLESGLECRGLTT